MRTDKPLLISIPEAGFQLSLPQGEIAALIRDGELVALRARGHLLVVYDSLTAFTRRAQRSRSSAKNGTGAISATTKAMISQAGA
jgi:hypothetical protein